MLFSKEKKDFLLRADKSRAGCIDSAVRGLVDRINLSGDYCTASSCAGRISVIESGRKPAKWVFVSHEMVSAVQVADAVKNYSGGKDLWFRAEPMILHVRCSTIQAAQHLVDVARSVGFKRSGIQATKSKVVVEVSSSEIIDAPVLKAGVAVPESYFSVLAGEANMKLAESHKKIEKLKALI